MRKLILYMQVSLDGFVEGPNADMSWINDDPEQWEQIFVMLEDVDLAILGRKMFADYRDYWTKALNNPAVSAHERAYADCANSMKHVVFSNTLADAGWHNTEVAKGNVVDEVRRLKDLPGKHIYAVGGATLAHTLIDAGLVDEYRLVIIPVILGGGKSFYKDLNQKVSLDLLETKTSNGAVWVRCRPKQKA